MAMKNSILLKRKLKFIRDMKADDACLIGCCRTLAAECGVAAILDWFRGLLF
jgi:hypothetical protein